MSKNTGTLVGAPLKQADSADLYPVAFAGDIRGGHHSVADTAARDAMPAFLREAGMTCYCISDSNTYQLQNDLITWALFGTGGAQTFNTTINPGGNNSGITYSGTAGTVFKFSTPLPAGNPLPQNMGVFVGGVQIGSVTFNQNALGQPCAVDYNGHTYTSTFQNSNQVNFI